MMPLRLFRYALSNDSYALLLVSASGNVDIVGLNLSLVDLFGKDYCFLHFVKT